VLYDDNWITIEGRTDLAFSENVGRRYEAYGWHVEHADGHDHESIAAAISSAVAEHQRPSLVVCRTHIANGAPTKHDTADAHGSPLGADEIAAAKRLQDWPVDPTFRVPDEVKSYFRERAEEGFALRLAWEEKLDRWREADSPRAELWDSLWNRTVPDDIVDRLMQQAPTEAGATRAHGGQVLQRAAEYVPSLVGGSADLSPSTKTVIKGSASVGPGEYEGRNLHYGIREHAMGAVVNGFLYHGAFRPYGATFLVFSDYMRPPLRVAGLSGLPAIHVFTHDSIFVGEDGPTHQPVEQAWALRMIPNQHVYRPADGRETALAWGMALKRTDGPTVMLLSRQTLPPIEPTVSGELADPRRGAYLVRGDERPEAILAATGSEVHLAIAAYETLAAEGKKLAVVSIPCVELFHEQPDVYRQRLFPRGVRVATIEAGVTLPWRALTGPDGLTIGIDIYGASAPSSVVAEKFGLTPEAVTAKIREWLG